MKLKIYKEQINKIQKMEDCIDSGIPSLAKVRKEKGEEPTIQILTHYIKEVNKYFNFKVKMTDQQTFITCKLILKDYYWLNMADLKIVFENMLAKKYGDYYGKLDGGDFMDGFKAYSDDRLGLAEHMSQEKHSRTKQKRVEGDLTMRQRWNQIKGD